MPDLLPELNISQSSRKPIVLPTLKERSILYEIVKVNHQTQVRPLGLPSNILITSLASSSSHSVALSLGMPFHFKIILFQIKLTFFEIKLIFSKTQILLYCFKITLYFQLIIFIVSMKSFICLQIHIYNKTRSLI